MPHRLNILLIDNDADDIEVIRQTLENADPDHRLTVAQDGKIALKLLHDQEIQHPYIILLDLSMPSLDGFQFLNELRRNPLLRANIVFVITAALTDDNKLLLYHEGIAGYLPKQKLGQRYEQLAAFLIAYHALIEYPERSAI